MTIKKCSRCYTDNPIIASYCRHCGYKFSEESKQGKSSSPIIHEIQVMSDFYTIGSFVDIMWNVSNATTILLNGENVTNHDSYEYQVKGDETLEMTAMNDLLATRKHIKLSPHPLPVIVKFAASRSKVEAGSEITIHIEYKHADRVTLQSNISPNLEVSKKKSIKVCPKHGEIFTLVCYSKDPNIFVKKELELNVLETLEIGSFEVDRQNVIESEPVTLRWAVQGANKIILRPGEIDVSNLSAVEVRPSRSTTYWLEVSNGLKSKTKTLSISVQQIPKFNYEIPKFSTIDALSSVKLDLTNLPLNLWELRVDKWLFSPLKQTGFLHLVEQWINKFSISNRIK